MNILDNNTQGDVCMNRRPTYKAIVQQCYNISTKVIKPKCAGSVLFQLNQVNNPAPDVLAMKQAAARIVIK